MVRLTLESIVKFLVVVSVPGILLTAFVIHTILQPPNAPPPFPETWWGPGAQPAKEDTSVREFKINIPDKDIKDLQQRLSSLRPLKPSIEDAGFSYGFNSKVLEDIITHWKTKYSWRERETYLNKYPQFKTRIQGLDIHFIHVKPKLSEKDKARGVQVLPLLLIHGWPGSIREFYDVIPLLTKPKEEFNFVFEIIAPSIPGFIFSDGTNRPGLHSGNVAVILNGLMKRLNLNKYFVQGGDWGAIIGGELAVLFPESVRGVHSNLCVTQSIEASVLTLMGSIVPWMIVPARFQNRLYPLHEYIGRIVKYMGYMYIQATKPDTIGFGLQDSPVGLAAYVLDKFMWTNEKLTPPDGALSKFSYDSLLDNIMLYWHTNSITTSMRLYAETLSLDYQLLQINNVPIKVPSACARYPNEIFYQTDRMLKTRYYNLVHSSDLPRGGHFPAFEEPELFSGDLWSAVDKMLKSEEKLKRQEL